LFREYQRDINVDLCFQSFERELRRLPRCTDLRWRLVPRTDPPTASRPVVSHCDGSNRDLRDETALRQARCARHHLGRELVTVLLTEARRLGYIRVRLDTLASMRAARALYASLGFVNIPLTTTIR